MIKILIVNCIISLITGPSSSVSTSLDGRFIRSNQNEWIIDFSETLDKRYLVWNNSVQGINSNRCNVIKQGE